MYTYSTIQIIITMHCTEKYAFYVNKSHIASVYVNMQRNVIKYCLFNIITNSQCRSKTNYFTLATNLKWNLWVILLLIITFGRFTLDGKVSGSLSLNCHTLTSSCVVRFPVSSSPSKAWRQQYCWSGIFPVACLLVGNTSSYLYIIILKAVI